MDTGIVSMRYAKALMGFAEAKGVEKGLYDEISVLARSLASSSELKAAIANPVISADKKYYLMCAATAGSGKVSDELSRFFRLVLKQRRESFLQFICLSYLDLYRTKEGIGVGRLITAVPVDAKTEERIRTSSGATMHVKMELTTEVDPSLEGGFIFDYNGVRLDASVATQLKRLKQQLIEKNRRIV
jgi:F-type H+-transporting ATPase subunit delta